MVSETTTAAITKRIGFSRHSKQNYIQAQCSYCLVSAALLFRYHVNGNWMCIACSTFVKDMEGLGKIEAIKAMIVQKQFSNPENKHFCLVYDILNR